MSDEQKSDEQKRSVRGRRPTISLEGPRKILLRTDAETHRVITEAAALAGTSMNQWAINVLTNAAFVTHAKKSTPPAPSGNQQPGQH